LVSFFVCPKPSPLSRLTLQVGPKTHYGPRNREDFDADAAFVMNHSCDPNTWFVGDTKMTARRDIEPEEELTYDYATTDTVGAWPRLHRHHHARPKAMS
jgi:hypothetical protein